MLENKKLLIFALIFILFLSSGIVSASDLEDFSLDSNMVSEDDSLILHSISEDDSLIDGPLKDNSISEEKTIDSDDLKNKGISADSINATKSADNVNKVVAKTKTKITASNHNAYYKDKSSFKICLRDSKNNALKNKAVKISVNHKTYFKTTNGFGLVALKLNLKPGKYNVRIAFDGDDEYCASSLKTAFAVKKAPLSIITRNSKSYFYHDTFFKAKVINKLTKRPVDGIKVLFKVFFSKNKYKKYYSLTDEKGMATLYKRLKTGKYDVYSFIKAKKNLFSYKNEAKKVVLTAMDTREMGCASIYVYANKNESALAFRRDSTYGANLHVVAKKWYGRTAIKQYKLAGTYFFHAITTSDGWLIGTGGWDNPTVNKNIERLAGKMVSSNKISKSLLRSVLAQERRLPTGHFAIVAPDGRYAALWRSGYIKGKLDKGEYLKVPNARSLFRHGNFKRYSKYTAKAALKIAATDPFGINRRNIMVYHYKRTTKNYKTNASVNVYASNDKGNLLGRFTGGLKDNVYYLKKFFSKSRLPGTPYKKFIGKYKFGRIDKLIKTKTIVSARNVSVKYNQSSYFKLTLKDKTTKRVLKKVKINLRLINGNEIRDYFVRTDKNGIARFNTKVLEAGNYKVLIKPGNNRYMISAKSNILINDVLNE